MSKFPRSKKSSAHGGCSILAKKQLPHSYHLEKLISSVSFFWSVAERSKIECRNPNMFFFNDRPTIFCPVPVLGGRGDGQVNVRTPALPTDLSYVGKNHKSCRMQKF